MAAVVMKGRALIPIAEALAGGHQNDPRARSAVNRAYYAAYLEVSQYVNNRGFQHVAAQGSHQRTWNYLASLPDPDLTRRAEHNAIRSQGLMLKDRRTKADYRPSSRLEKAEGKEAVREARGIIRALDRLGP